MAFNLFTIAADQPFLDVLARVVMTGFPLAPSAKRPPLSAWTLLVPNRKTAFALQNIFLDQAEEGALVLPRIKPIGDLDDNFFDETAPPLTLPQPVSPIARHFMLIALIGRWCMDHPHLALAQTLLRSDAQIDALAQSLTQLIDSLEVEERDLSTLREAFDLDLAHHREAILSLLDLIHRDLPALQHREGLMGAKDRRSRLIRMNADQLALAGFKGPVIAAGSTGTIPATRYLLSKIANLPQGAVVLPGLDLMASSESWQAVGPQHPQYAMKRLLEAMGVKRSSVQLLGAAAGDRAWLAAEVMRPSEVSDDWANILPRSTQRIRQAMQGVDLLPCRDRKDEAATIAALIRRGLETPSGSLALITPDRNLARRVTSALGRWNITPMDTAGEALIGLGAARFMGLILDLAQAPHSLTALAALLHHPAFRISKAPAASAAIDAAFLRSPLMAEGLAQIPQLITAIPLAARKGIRPEAIAIKPGDEQWASLALAAQALHAALSPLLATEKRPFEAWVLSFLDLAQHISNAELWSGPDVPPLLQLLDTLKTEGHRLTPLSIGAAAALLRSYMQRETLVISGQTTPRVFIAGLLEARSLYFDTVILGGLNEGIWPGAAETGPWLNRPMRESLSIPLPEASIGQMAHDFGQALGNPHVVLSWSDRDGKTPLLPSRWILRLLTLLSAAGLTSQDHPVPETAAISRLRRDLNMLNSPQPGLGPVEAPRPCPPAAARPKRISLTQVRTLIDDPYEIYATDVLKLTPLAPLNPDNKNSLRGQIFHLILTEFFTSFPLTPPEDPRHELLAVARRLFTLLAPSLQMTLYWEPRFRRIAEWISLQIPELYEPEYQLHAEAQARHVLDDAAGIVLSGRADLLRFGAGGKNQILDFKTGEIPPLTDTAAGFTYQLTLEAALLEQGAFKGLPAAKVSALRYVGISGGVPAGEFKNIPAETLAHTQDHLRGLSRLLSAYSSTDQPYLPRINVKKESDKRTYDHYSRYREWLRGPEE